MSRYIEKAQLLEMPVLPLRGISAFPAVQINLEILREASLKAFAAIGSDGYLFLTAQKDIEIATPTPKDLYKVGTVCKVKQVVKNQNNTLSVVFEGVCRARIAEIKEKNGYLSAEVVCKTVIEESTPSAKAEELLKEAKDIISSIKKIHPLINEDFYNTAMSVNTPGFFSDLVASTVLLNGKNKQLVLECFNPMTRLEKLVMLLEEETMLLECEFKIHQQVRKKIDEHQKEFYLREQIKSIQAELGEDLDEIEEYHQKIEASHLPKEIEDKLLKELNKLSKTPFGAAESTVLRNYLDTCLDIPWNKHSSENLNIRSAKAILERDHEGLKKIKERMLEYIAVKKLAPDVKNQTICLIGPPGVGKTSIAASLARAMKRKYARISLGGIRDEADIRGHRKTYVGAMPGRIVDAIIEAKAMNPVIVLDEIDKLCRDNHGDPASALLEALDPEQNKYFRDHFVELPLDLSDCIFIATANSYEGIPDALLDRMEVIELSTYTRTEKFAIAEKHLLPKQMKRHGLKKSTFKISDGGLYEIIDFYTRESGVRNLERELATLCRKAATRIAEESEKTIRVSEANVSLYLGKRKFLSQSISSENEIGVVNGLAYTTSGGDMLKVEVAVLEGTGKIELTGSLGDVMKESAKIVISYIRSIASFLKIDANYFEKKDIHIHFPEGAVPKDGPSAGVTMACALASAVSLTPVKSSVAMTGEITLRGKVLPIGGLKEKTLAAYCAGATTVLIPRANEKDLDDIDEEARRNLNFVLCDTVMDVLENAFVSMPEKTQDSALSASINISIPQTHISSATIS